MSSRMCLLLGSAALIFTGAAAAPALSDEHGVTERLNREYRVMPRPNPYHRIVWVRRWVWDDFWGDYHMVWVPKRTTYRTVSYTHSHKTHAATVSDGGGDRASTKSDDATSGNAGKSGQDKAAASVEPKARPQTATDERNNSKLASIDTHAKPTPTAEKPAAKVTADLTKPVTPAEIRSAIPVAKVSDPKQTLASTPIKSVWGDTIGKVSGVDVNGGNLKTVDADLGGKSVVKMNPSHLKYVKSRGLLITTLSKDDAAKLPKANNS